MTKEKINRLAKLDKKTWEDFKKEDKDLANKLINCLASKYKFKV